MVGVRYAARVAKAIITLVIIAFLVIIGYAPKHRDYAR